MVQKRQLAEEEYDVSPKHLKLERSCELVPFLQFTKEDALLYSDKDDGCIFKPILGVDYGFVSNSLTDLPVSTTKDVDYTLPGRLSTSSWTSSTTSEEDIRSETPRILIQPENTYSYLLEHPPLKQVPIGPEYQAYIPETSQPNSIDENKFMGSCIIPMPEEHQNLQDNNNNIGRGRTDCFCESLDCVEQHINEARELLKESIGHERFTELGFCNMGESVSEKWTDEDEQLFQEVVYSNPVSFGKNFWNILSEVFPSCTNQEIVSYYFNVFMLRKRAEQNRCDPLNADSDDDEWQGSDDRSEETEPEYDSHENGNEFIFETSDSRVWDIGYFSCQKTQTDFLPTGSMIESWDFEVTDDNRSSSN